MGGTSPRVPVATPAPASDGTDLPPRPDAAPRLYYGWVLVGVLAFTEITSWGVLYYGFAVFVPSMAADLGWNRATLTGAFSLGLLVSGVAGVFTGRWLDRHGSRALMTAGSVLASLMLLAWAAVGHPAVFFLVWAGIGAAMAAVLYEPAFAVVAQWFVRKRSRALTILTFVAGFASVTYVPLIAWLVQAQGWRAALVTLAGLLALFTIPAHALLLRRRPQDMGLLPDGSPAPVADESGTHAPPAEASISREVAVRSASFRWLSLAFTLAFLVNVAITVHLIAYLTERGYGAGFAAAAAGAIGAAAIPGRLILTPLGGVLPRRWVTAGIFLVQAVALAALLLVPGAAGVWAFVVLFGAGFGAITPARAAMVAELYGPAHYGAIGGVLALVITGARAAAPVGTGLLVTALGRYEPVLWLLAAVTVLAGLATLRIERPLAVG